MRAVAAGEIVEQSMTRPPAASPSPTPSGPRMTASTSGVSRDADDDDVRGAGDVGRRARLGAAQLDQVPRRGPASGSTP